MFLRGEGSLLDNGKGVYNGVVLLVIKAALVLAIVVAFYVFWDICYCSKGTREA